MSSTKTRTIPRLVADIERDLAEAKKPGPQESQLGADGYRLTKMSKLLTELAKAKPYWAEHDAAESVRRDVDNRQRESQIYQNLEHESNPTIRRRQIDELRAIRGFDKQS